MTILMSQKKQAEANRIVSMKLTEAELNRLSRRVGTGSRSRYLQEVLRRDLDGPTREEEQELRFREFGNELQTIKTEMHVCHLNLLQEIQQIRTLFDEHFKAVKAPQKVEQNEPAVNDQKPVRLIRRGFGRIRIDEDMCDKDN